MSTEPDASRRLAALARAARADAQPRDDCPSADQIWRVLHLEASTDERLRVIDHLADCPVCAEAWQLAREIEGQDSQPAAAPTVDGSWLRGRRLWASLAAASLIVVVGSMLALRWREPPEPGARDRPPDAIRSLLPENVRLPRQAFVLRWSEGPAGTRYDLVVTTANLEMIADVRGLDRPEYTVSAERLAPVVSGARLLWRVVANLPDGGTRSSATHTVTVQ